jgi:hypothetical protein
MLFLFLGGGSAAIAWSSEDCTRLMARLHDSFDRFLNSPRLLSDALERPNAQALLELKKGEGARLYYVVTSDDRLYFSRTPVAADAGGPGFAVTQGASGVAEVVPFREAGEVRYADLPGQPKTFRFEQTSGMDPTADEVRAIERELKASDGGDRLLADHHLAKAFAEGGAQARVIDCAKILDRNTRGGRFILDSITNTAGLSFGGIAITAPERFIDVAHMNVLAADFVSPLVNTLFKSASSYWMISRNQGALRRYAVRMATIGGSVGLQAGIYDLFDVGDVKSIGAYTLGYALVMIPKGDLVDRFVFQKLPKLAFESCLKNSVMRFIVSPRTVRIVDGLISTVIFLEGRKAIIGK